VSLRRSLRSGFTAIAPILLGVVPFGLVAGFSAVDAGLSVLQASGLSLLVFAGASQLAAIDLIRQDAAVVVIVLTVIIINTRFLMYSASLAPHFAGTGAGRRLGLAYLLTDQAYAVSVSHYEASRPPRSNRIAYYLGAALGLWVTWQICTVAGALAGAGIPDDWSLDFAIPLVFLALLVPAVSDRSRRVAAAVAGIAAVTAAGLPYNIGLPLGATAGIVAGFFLAPDEAT
jgi:4-azaleucine resistance transporter AzlC